VYETAAGYRRDQPEWTLKRARGVIAHELTGAEARALEPALGPLVHRAVFTPQWSHVGDPRRIALGLRAWLLARGTDFHAGDVQDIEPAGVRELTLRLAGSAPLRATQAVVAAGAWSGRLARRLGDAVLLESERGYTTTLPAPGIRVGRELIFAERKFVATPLSCGLRIGGTAEFAGLSAWPNFERSRVLVSLARRYLPDLNAERPTYWAGHRPATPDGLPVIGPSARCPNVFYAFGHGHLGLTQAATTGRLLSDLMLARQPSVDLTPYRIQRFDRHAGRAVAAPHLLLH
jgi:D-amino-acid dehydrogenase